MLGTGKMMSISRRISRIQELLKVADESVLKKVEELLEQGDLMQAESKLSDEHKRIIDARLAQHHSNPTEGRPWDEVKAEIKSKYES